MSLDRFQVEKMIRHQDIDGLINVLSSLHPSLTKLATEALGEIEDEFHRKRAISKLVTQIRIWHMNSNGHGEAFEVICAHLKAIEKIGHPSAIQYLRDALQEIESKKESRKTAQLRAFDSAVSAQIELTMRSLQPPKQSSLKQKLIDLFYYFLK